MNISNTRNCFGCGVCAIACAKHIISIEQNADGFFEPRITQQDKCTDCGLCMDVCSYNHDDLALKNPTIKAYAAWSKDPAIRKKCSSGGVGFEVGRTVIADGGKVCGVRYDVKKNQAEHYVASTDRELIPSIGSKYIQSYTVEGFAEVARLVRESRKTGVKSKFLIIGTPCQVDSFRRWSQKFKYEDQFIFLDFFCHGVPSKLMWDKYIQNAKNDVGRIVSVSWRNKFAGWHDSWAFYIKGIKGEKKSWFSNGDVFYKLYLGDLCTNIACSERCRFKYDKSSSDIRIGDAWGDKYSDNEEGVSIACTFSKIGESILENSFLEIVEHEFSVVAEGQMRTNVTPAILASCFSKYILKNKTELNERLCLILFKLERIISLPRRIFNKLTKRDE